MWAKNTDNKIPLKGTMLNSNMNNKRPLCSCKKRPVAINYIKDNKTYYRKKCDKCLRLDRGLTATPYSNWGKSGYKKKKHCERCNFVAEHPIQLNVYHIDGNRNNNNWKNLKTVCSNCYVMISDLGIPWKQGDLVPDF